MRLILLLMSMLLIGSADAQRKQSDSLRMDGYENDHVGGSDNVGDLKQEIFLLTNGLADLLTLYQQLEKHQATTDSILDKMTQGNLHLIQGCIDEKRRLDHLIEFLQHTAIWKKSL